MLQTWSASSTCSGERPRLALPARLGNALGPKAPATGYGFGTNFVIGERGGSGSCSGNFEQPSLRCRCSTFAETCEQEICLRGRLRRSPGSRLCGISLLASLEHFKRLRKDYANQPVEQADERRPPFARRPRCGVCLTGRWHRAGVPDAHFWWRASSDSRMTKATSL